MKPITYLNKKTNIPGWVNNLHIEQKYGYAYETDTHFVHFYGKEPYFIISVGLTVIEAKTGTLKEWIEKRFGASEIVEMNLELGHTMKGVWRPSLYFLDDIKRGLSITDEEIHAQEQALRILIEKLDEILLFIEPSDDGLKAYSHKTRELLILACTEVENQWRSILKKTNYNVDSRNLSTNDYIKINRHARLEDYSISLRFSDQIPGYKPFINWDESNPTQSISWYNAYNKTKHNREEHFTDATLENAIHAVFANVALFCARFSPLTLINGNTSLSALINQTFEISMINSDRKTFYIPRIELPSDTRKDCLVYDCYKSKHNKQWIVDTITLN